MAESQFLSVIQVWAALAWADGKIADAEAAAIRRLIESADLEEPDRQTALSWLETPVELETEQVAALGEEARRGVYRAAARLAAVDLDVAREERSFLERLRIGLGLDNETTTAIEAVIPGLKR